MTIITLVDRSKIELIQNQKHSIKIMTTEYLIHKDLYP